MAEMGLNLFCRLNLRQLFVLGAIVLAACGSAARETPDATGEYALAVESFLADIAQNVAGERVKVEALVPAGLDPHTFEPTPQDVARITNSQLVIANGAGLEEWLQEVLDNAGGDMLVIEASQGLPEISPRPDDPHFWLDPNFVMRYVENIRQGLTRIDPAGEQTYAENSAAYTAQLEGLHSWINAEVDQIEPERRILVTNHESFAYFAARYGFEVVGTIVPSVSTGASPSAQQLVQLVEAIRQTGAQAIFLESGTNPELAEQVAREAGVKVIQDLHTHSISPPGGYIEMMKYNTQTIVEALR
jgi:ABC-type Zn uptake system ZnuABC Zn-binding protein ZnuA